MRMIGFVGGEESITCLVLIAVCDGDSRGEKTISNAEVFLPSRAPPTILGWRSAHLSSDIISYVLSKSDKSELLFQKVNLFSLVFRIRNFFSDSFAKISVYIYNKNGIGQINFGFMNIP